MSENLNISSFVPDVVAEKNSSSSSFPLIQVLVTGVAKKFSLWSNGIVQNTVFFALLVDQIPGFKATLGYVDEVDVKDQTYFADMPDNIVLLPHSKLIDHSFDVIVQMGYGIPQDELLKYKAKFPKVKIVSYICG